MRRIFLIVSGPTGVGKTDIVNALCKKIKVPVEIINGDMGQMYAPLSIGTAKPEWQKEPVAHHLFDIITEPENFTVAKYRQLIVDKMESLWQKGILPIIVGGSGFYLKSLFFSIFDEASTDKIQFEDQDGKDLWSQLNEIDPKRAQAIAPSDTYRVLRALALWRETGKKPSEYAPSYNPPGKCLFIFINRDRDELYKRIDERVISMVDSGWISEVKGLDENWISFLHEKKIIGYREIIQFINGELSREKMIEQISQKTRNYAKRQITFWRSFKEQLLEADKNKGFIMNIDEVNLTYLDLNLYIDQQSNKITNLALEL